MNIDLNKIEAAFMKGLQKTVDDFRAKPQYVEYVNNRSLALIDSRLEVVDRYLERGILK